MADYTLRIQLVGKPDQEVYDDLHARMKKGGFLQTVTGSKTVALPHGTYFGSVDASPTDVSNWAKSHAKEAWGKSIVFVAQTSTWSWASS